MLYAPLAERALQRGDVEEAIRIAEEGLARHPGHMAGERALGRALLARGGREDLARALRLLQGVAERTPERPEAWALVAETAERLSERAVAARAWRRVRDLGGVVPERQTPPEAPGPPEPAPEPAGADGPDEEADAAGDGDPFETPTMAELLLRQGHREEARALLRRLVARSPDDQALKERLSALEGEP